MRTYTGNWGRDGVCRIRIFAAPDEVPVVVATELEDNTGPSITNFCEYIAAEVIARHFPERFEAEIPLIWVEEYPRTPEQRSRGMPAFSQAEFSSFTPRMERLGEDHPDPHRSANLAPPRGGRGRGLDRPTDED